MRRYVNKTLRIFGVDTSISVDDSGIKRKMIREGKYTLMKIEGEDESLKKIDQGVKE